MYKVKESTERCDLRRDSISCMKFENFIWTNSSIN